MTLERLRQITVSVRIPVVAICGISRENIAWLEGTGAAGAAVVSGIFAAEDIQSECRILREACSRIAMR